jgi:hypothetical protein
MHFVDKLIHAGIANHYSSDGLRCLCATAQISYLKILEV